MSQPPAPVAAISRLKLPDVTLVQLAAVTAWIVGQAVTMAIADAFKTKAVVSGGLTAVTVAWIVADAIIRNGRSRSMTNVVPEPRHTTV